MSKVYATLWRRIFQCHPSRALADVDHTVSLERHNWQNSRCTEPAKGTSLPEDRMNTSSPPDDDSQKPPDFDMGAFGWSSDLDSRENSVNIRAISP
jgi:hypothetical protein